MPNGNGTIWKTLGPALLGIVGGVVIAGVVSTFQLTALAAEVRAHDSAPEIHAVLKSRVDMYDTDIRELKDLLQSIDSKIDRYHEER